MNTMKSMRASSRAGARRWRAIRSFAAIVVGVVVALSAQALWEYHQAREQERFYLTQLLNDMRENQNRLDRALAHDSAYLRSVRTLRHMLRSPHPIPSLDTVEKYFTTNLTSFTPISGTLDALIRSGDIGLIRNDSVRAAIIQYAAQLSDVSDRLDILESFTWTLLRARAEREEAMSRPAADDAELEGQRLALIDMNRLRRDPELQANLRMTEIALVNHVSAIASVGPMTRHLRESLESDVRRQHQ